LKGTGTERGCRIGKGRDFNRLIPVFQRAVKGR